MQTYHLFRLKAIRSPQSALFNTDLSRKDFISELINRKPSSATKTDYVWHIGNVQQVGPDGIVFAVGRTTVSSKELYDERTQDFIEVEDEASPFTTAFYDKKFSVLAIAPKTKLSPTIKGIARCMEKLLNDQPYVLDNGVRIEIAEIWDPDDFIKHIMNAYAVTGLTVGFGEPNPFDVDKDFHEPMEKLLEASGGIKGKTSIQGEDLDREQIEKVARSIASTGNEATARLKQKKGQKTVVKHMKGDAVTVNANIKDIRKPKDQAKFLEKIRSAYSRVRNRG